MTGSAPAVTSSWRSAMRPDQPRLPRRAGRASPTTTRDAATADTAPSVVRCDLDGVIWRGDEPDRARGRGHRRRCAPPACASRSCRTTRTRRSATSSPSSTAWACPPTPGDVVTSATAAAWLLAQSLAPRAPGCSRAPARACGGARRGRSGRGRRRPGRRGGGRLPPRVRLRRARPRVGARCAPGRGSSPPTSTPPTRSPAG